MQKLLPSINRPATSLVYFLVLTAAFFLLEVSFFIVCNDKYLGDFTFVASQIPIPAAVWPEIIKYVGIQCLVHFSFCIVAWLTAIYSGYLLKVPREAQFNYAITVWCILLVTVFILNQFYYPNSKFASLSAVFFFNPFLLAVAVKILTTLSAVLCAGAVSGFLIWIMDYSMKLFLLVLSGIALSSGFSYMQLLPQPIRAAHHQQPNVIMVGVDSLRPDFLSYFGREYDTPFLDSVLKTATVFTEAVTPLARTFPSWTSMLLGEYPVQSGVRSNLAKTDTTNFQQALPMIFREHGYETIYATDETRFSNIDQQFGFNQILTPTVGVTDFLFGTFNDFPLSNLLVNTALGRYLFPYSYGNRAAFVTYQPNSFIKLMAPALLAAQQKPLFLAVHFCLPHFPYAYADLHGEGMTNQVLYRASIERVDKQLSRFFGLLQQARLLDNAIVVVLSDHGEALELSGDRITAKESFMGKGQAPKFYPAGNDMEAVNQSAGHGTDVLGLPQYHSLLAFKLYGREVQRTGDVQGVVSLVDIKSALLSLANIQPDGSSMADMVLAKINVMPTQHVFLESDYSPAAIRKVYPEVRDVLLEGAHIFEINPLSLRLHVKDDMGVKIIQSKQYADIYQDWMLAFYPQERGGRMAILVNLKTGRWTNDLSSSFALQSPAALMHTKMKAKFGQAV